MCTPYAILNTFQFIVCYLWLENSLELPLVGLGNMKVILRWSWEPANNDFMHCYTKYDI